MKRLGQEDTVRLVMAMSSSRFVQLCHIVRSMVHRPLGPAQNLVVVVVVVRATL